MARAYLDHASSSPLRPVALDAMLPYLREHHGDPGRVHTEGRTTRVALEVAREQVAQLVGARPREVIFTSSGTEAINAAVWGACAHARESGHVARVVTTAVEHSSVLDAAGRHADDVVVLDVDRTGRVDPDRLRDVIALDSVALLSVQTANHEVGTRQPVAGLVAIARESGALVHVDACMSVGHDPLEFVNLGADLCSITAHKVGGPKGAGALLVRRGLRVPPLLLGGAQERARRGGLENVPAAIGFGAAAEALAGGGVVAEAEAARALTGRVRSGVLTVDDVTFYGDDDDRVPHLVCLGVGGVEAEPVVLGLDQRGVAVHSGSSCSSEMLEPSPVLAAMGADAEHSLRISVGWSSTDADVDAFLAAFPDVVARLRALRA